MSAQLAPLSASVTRILSLTGFSKELKTKDIQAAFSDWENVQGGFRIKWIDDTSLMIVFNDAGIAKRAYLRALCTPPPTIFSSSTETCIRPYDGPDAQAIIQTVNSRHQSSSSKSQNPRPGPTSGANGHMRMASGSIRSHGQAKHSANSGSAIFESSIAPALSHASNGSVSSFACEPSPTIPIVPAQPALRSLISSTSSSFADEAILHDPAILATEPSGGSAPRIGDPGKRMLGAALGVRHPGLGPRTVTGSIEQDSLKEVQRTTGGLTVSE